MYSKLIMIFFSNKIRTLNEKLQNLFKRDVTHTQKKKFNILVYL